MFFRRFQIAKNYPIRFCHPVRESPLEIISILNFYMFYIVMEIILHENET